MKIKLFQEYILESQTDSSENFYQDLHPKEAIQKAMIDYSSALKKNNTGQANKIAGNLKTYLELQGYNWKQDPHAMEILSDFIE